VKTQGHGECRLKPLQFWRHRFKRGQKFDRLTIVRRVPNSGLGWSTKWQCLCSCGQTTFLIANRLVSGRTKSCGCLQRDKARAAAKHGMCTAPIYKRWHAMIERCTNPKHKYFKYYGGRGITVCRRWRTSFQNFIDDLPRMPRPGMTLDRIKNNKGYTLGNVRWATREEQSNNIRSNVLLTFRGKTMSVARWARHLGCRARAIHSRLERGWSAAEALSTPFTGKWLVNVRRGTDRCSQCDKKAQARGYCPAHYQRLRKSGAFKRNHKLGGANG